MQGVGADLQPIMQRRPARRISWVVVALGTIGLFQVLLAIFSIQLLAAVQSYVIGESLYSKAQKDAHIHLLEYLQSGTEEDHRQFLDAVAIPVGDRMAREELDKAAPDFEVVRRAFLAGGNHPDDIDGLIWLYRWFHDSSLMAEAIASWREGDLAVAELQAVDKQLGLIPPPRRFEEALTAEVRAKVASINLRLTRLERTFSDRLAFNARLLRRAAIAINALAAALLGFLGLGIVRRGLRDRELAAHEIRRRQQLLQQLLDSTTEGLLGVDTRGFCTFVNRAALDRLGYRQESELVGREVHSVIHSRCGPVAGEQTCPVQQTFLKTEPAHRQASQFWDRQGRAFPVEYWAHPMYQDGRPDGAVVTFFDVSEQQRTKAALEKSEAKLAKLIEAVADAVISADEHGRIVLFNRAAEQVFRLPAEQVLGRPVAELFKDLALLVGGAPAAAPGGKPLELVGLRGDVPFPAEATFSRVDTGPGPQTTIVLRDVSEQLAMRREREQRQTLEAHSRAKTEFLSRMSHELRTPLNAVLGFAQLMNIDLAHPLDPLNQARARHIERAGAHLLALVNDVLDLSMVESGRLSLSLQAVEARAVAEEASSVAGTLSEEGRIELDVSFPGPLWVHADEVRLRQSLINLLSNAIKYGGREGPVTLSLVPQHDHCQFSVKDQGPGMTDSQLTHLFEPFNRLGAEHSGVEGTGIGLVLTRQLVQAMGGELAVESAPGQGTRATITLPWAAAPQALAAPRWPVAASSSAARLDVLYAEDNDVNIELMSQLVKLRSWVTFRAANSGALALAMFMQRRPDLVLIDMNLGDVSGLELAAQLRALPGAATARLVALSADALPHQVRMALDSGFEGYLTKPINFAEVLGLFDRLGGAPAPQSASTVGH